MKAIDCARKYPRLTAHMICCSLGYFTPEKAACAIAHYKTNEPFFCEWYSHMGQFQNERGDLFDDASVLKVGRHVIKESFLLRKRHKGYMADYRQAKALVDRYINTGQQPELASWF